MAKDPLDKLAKKQQSLQDKAKGLTFQKRQGLAAKAGAIEDQINDAMINGASLLEFMRRFSVDPTGKGHMRTVIGAPHVGRDGLPGALSMTTALDTDATQVSAVDPNVIFGEYTTGTRKIAYGRLTKDLARGNRYNLVVETAAKAHSFPIYYLPWASDRMLRLQIPVRGTSGLAEDPDIFFTAGINGCSVFIEGSRQSPTIYHGGSENALLPSNAGQYWRNLYKEWSATGAGDVKGAKTYGEVKKSQYVNAIGKDPTQDATYAGKQTDTSLGYKTWLQTNQKDIDVTSLQPWGSVFGIRDAAGDWTFYLQKNATVEYFNFPRSHAGLGARKREATKMLVDSPMELVQVYPGRAHVRLQTYTTVREGF